MQIEDIIGYHFKDKDLLDEALTHPSLFSAKQNKRNYERLEFLGDSVISLVVSEMLFTMFPDESEGKLAKRRANLVCRDAIVKIAEEVNLGRFLKLSAGEENMGGRKNRANLENTFEAIAGAVYLDGGYRSAKAFVTKLWKNLIEDHEHPIESPKTILQEWAQSMGKPVPHYKVITTEGPSHAPLFTIEVTIDGKKTKASGSSKRDAEKKAATLMINKLGLL